MIAFVSCALAAYEAIAYITGAPKVTDLSRRPVAGQLIWLWWLWLGYHFLEARDDRQTVLRSRTSTRW